MLTIDSINQLMRKCRYDVRGEIYLAAVKRTQEGKEVIYTNVGNPQALGQIPLSFNRQVMALLLAPFLLETPEGARLFPRDAIERAKVYLANLKGGMGAYTDSKGNPYIRKEVANFIESQSGFPADPENIFISNGASECVRMLLFAMIRGAQDGVMVPIPQVRVLNEPPGAAPGARNAVQCAHVVPPSPCPPHVAVPAVLGVDRAVRRRAGAVLPGRGERLGDGH